MQLDLERGVTQPEKLAHHVPRQSVLLYQNKHTLDTVYLQFSCALGRNKPSMKIPEYYRVKAERGRANKVGTPATLTLAEWEQTIKDFNGLCAYCLERPYALLEHFMPVEVAGTHVKNCIPACVLCNMKKRNYIGDALLSVFGNDTIKRIRSYLDTRIEQPGEKTIVPRKRGSKYDDPETFLSPDKRL